MKREHKPDPYDGFKDDSERRRALNVRAISYAVVAATIGLSSQTGKLATLGKWLVALLH